VWIGNVDPTLTPADLLQIFAPFGPVESLRILSDKECAFVNYFTIEDATRAKDEMQGARIGATIVKLGFGKVDVINEIQGMQPTKSLWIGNIPATTDPADLEYLFSAFGSIESARVLTHKNCGFVNFDRLEDAIEARKQMNGAEIAGSVLKIGFAKVPSTGPGAAATTTTSITTTSLSSTTNQSTISPSALSNTSPGSSLSPERLQSNPSISITLPNRTNSASTSENNVVVNTSTGKAGNSFPKDTNGASTTGATQAESLDPSNASSTSTTNNTSNASTTSSIGGMFPADQYASQLPALPEPNPNRRIDQNRLREMRKKLEGILSTKEVEAMFAEVSNETVDLCTGMFSEYRPYPFYEIWIW
jgi:protein JSN1